MQLIKCKQKTANLIFYLGFSLELLIMILGHSAFEVPLLGRLTQLAFLLFGCKVLCTKYSFKEWIMIALLGVIGSVSYFAMGDEWVLRIMMMVIAVKEVPFKQLMQYTFYVTMAATACIVVLSLLGVLGQTVDIRDYGRGEVEARWCLGFSHANNIHGTIWYLVSLGLYLYYEKTKVWHYIALTLANSGLYMLTGSRTGFLLVQLVIFAFLLVRYVTKIKESKWVYLVGLLSIMAISLLSAVAAKYGPTGEFLSTMDRALTGRITWAVRWAQIETWTLFSNPREWLPVDLGIVTLFNMYGYVVGFLYLFLNAMLIFKYYLKKRIAELILLVSCMFYTFMESSYTINQYLLCNIFFLLLLGVWEITKSEKEAVQ